MDGNEKVTCPKCRGQTSAGFLAPACWDCAGAGWVWGGVRRSVRRAPIPLTTTPPAVCGPGFGEWVIADDTSETPGPTPERRADKRKWLEELERNVKAGRTGEAEMQWDPSRITITVNGHKLKFASSLKTQPINVASGLRRPGNSSKCGLDRCSMAATSDGWRLWSQEKWRSAVDDALERRPDAKWEAVMGLLGVKTAVFYSAINDTLRIRLGLEDGSVRMIVALDRRCPNCHRALRYGWHQAYPDTFATGGMCHRCDEAHIVHLRKDELANNPPQRVHGISVGGDMLFEQYGEEREALVHQVEFHRRTDEADIDVLRRLAME